MVELCNGVFSSDKLEVEKKNSDKLIDIKPLIRSAVAERAVDSIVISATLSADPSAFLNPEYVIKALRDKCGLLSSADLMSEGYEIMRTGAYFGDMTESR
jgi:hypothetical protein